MQRMLWWCHITASLIVRLFRAQLGMLFGNEGGMFCNSFFLALVPEESRPGLHCAANLHYSLSFLPPRGRPIFQLLPIPQTGNGTFWYEFEQK